jgi:AcrR family transcriptional regulator
VPIHVDVDERLDAIARATIAVARREGAASVTIRGVAAELGGSTARVTNYIKNRTTLIGTAVTYMLRQWELERDTQLSGAPADQHLLELTRWTVAAEPDDLIFRQLLVELMSQHTTTAPSYLHYAHTFRDELATAAADAGATTPDLAGDLAFLLIRGFHYTTVEGWSPLAPSAIDDFLQRAVTLLTADTRVVTDM